MNKIYFSKSKKRHFWLLAVPSALYTALGSLLYLKMSPNALWLYLPFFIYYVLIPLIDFIVGLDTESPTSKEIEAMESDFYYVLINWAAVIFVWPAVLFNFWFVTHIDLPWYHWPIMAFNISFGVAVGAILGHTLGHSRNQFSRFLSTFTNAIAYMGHLSIDHNLGHHFWVATPEDSSSARMGESLYSFTIRDYFGGLARSWKIEATRMKRKELNVFNWQNRALRGHVYAVCISVVLVILFGWQVILWMVPSIAILAVIVGVSNYVTHYGLKRQRMNNGKYEPVQPHHSWNSDHRLSNILLLHISRHSDHHAHPGRGYQSVKTYPDLPTLPMSITAMTLIAFCPPLWFKKMNPLLIKMSRGSLSELNISHK